MLRLIRRFEWDSRYRLTSIKGGTAEGVWPIIYNFWQFERRDSINQDGLDWVLEKLKFGCWSNGVGSTLTRFGLPKDKVEEGEKENAK